MSKLVMSALLAAMIAAAGVSVVSSLASAADLPVPGHRHSAALGCGACGCLHVSYNYHRVLQSTYGIGFDPRNFDQTEPYYYFGRVKAYPRYWCDGLGAVTAGAG
jgi:hypothetical protein